MTSTKMHPSEADACAQICRLSGRHARVPLTDWLGKGNMLTTRVEPFDVFVCEANGGVAVRKLVLARAIAKDHGASAIPKDLLYFAIRI